MKGNDLEKVRPDARHQRDELVECYKGISWQTIEDRLADLDAAC